MARNPDAYLIAAAPDLKAEGEQSALMLEEAAKVFMGKGMNGMAAICRAQAIKQRKAIAKAVPDDGWEK